MKSSTIITALQVVFTTSVSAQSACNSVAAAIPSCGTQCLLSAGANVGCTDPTDFSCQCSSSKAIQASARGCVISACGIATALAVQKSANAVCSCRATAPANVPAVPTSAAPGPTTPAPAPTTLITATSNLASNPVPSGPTDGTSQAPQSSNGPASNRASCKGGNAPQPPTSVPSPPSSPKPSCTKNSTSTAQPTPNPSIPKPLCTKNSTNPAPPPPPATPSCTKKTSTPLPSPSCTKKPISTPLLAPNPNPTSTQSAPPTPDSDPDPSPPPTPSKTPCNKPSTALPTPKPACTKSAPTSPPPSSTFLTIPIPSDRCVPNTVAITITAGAGPSAAVAAAVAAAVTLGPRAARGHRAA